MNTNKAYHYTESGLDNIWLRNGFVIEETPYGEGVGISNIQGLHRAITRDIIDSPNPISAAELRFLRIELDLSQRRFGEYFGRSDQAVAKWEKGETITKDVDFLLRHIMRQTLGESTIYTGEVDRLRDLDRREAEKRVEFYETGHTLEKRAAA